MQTVLAAVYLVHLNTLRSIFLLIWNHFYFNKAEYVLLLYGLLFSISKGKTNFNTNYMSYYMVIGLLMRARFYRVRNTTVHLELSTYLSNLFPQLRYFLDNMLQSPRDVLIS